MFEDLQKEFGEQVRKGRMRYGLTQEMTAELLEISCSGLRKIEYGRGGSSWETWMKLSELFDIDLEELLEKHTVQHLNIGETGL